MPVLVLAHVCLQVYQLFHHIPYLHKALFRQCRSKTWLEIYRKYNKSCKNKKELILIKNCISLTLSELFFFFSNSNKRRAYRISKLIDVKNNAALPVGESHVIFLYELLSMLEVSIEMGMLIDSRISVSGVLKKGRGKVSK